MRYGIPYKGSKNQIAKKVVDVLPAGETLVDLFAGGCAITDCAMRAGKYKKYIVNDIDSMPIDLYKMALSGSFKNETRWISREDFKRLKGSDAYVRFCWSFGNNGDTYMYSKQIEPWKRALHFARAYGDFSELEKFGIKSDGSRSDIRKNLNEYKEKYVKWYLKNVIGTNEEIEIEKAALERKVSELSEELRLYLRDCLEKSGKRQADVDGHLGTNGMAGHYFGRSQWEFPKREAYEKMMEILPALKPYDSIYGFVSLWQSLQRLQRLQSLQSLQRLQSLEAYSTDYRNVPIPANSVVYCDIPYIGTSGYGKFQRKAGGFDHEEFYRWAKSQPFDIYISEYSMPDDFRVVAEFPKRGIFSGTANNLVIEKVYCNH